MMDYKRKIDFAIKLLRSIPQDGPLEISYSGGKDSDVILRLAQMAGVPHEAIYKQTTIDPPGTTAHVKEMGATIIRPKLSFFDIVEKKGTPTQRARFCCEILKEYKVYDRAVQGIRRHESTAREKRYKEPEMCRTYKRGGGKARIYYPILDWDLEDEERFVSEEGVKCAPLYYDEAGNFHAERRLGCIGCPLPSDRGRGDYLQYPKMLQQLVKHAQTYFDTHTHTSGFQKFAGSATNVVFHNLFCESYDEYDMRVNGGLFPGQNVIDTREYLSNYFNIEL